MLSEALLENIGIPSRNVTVSSTSFPKHMSEHMQFRIIFPTKIPLTKTAHVIYLQKCISVVSYTLISKVCCKTINILLTDISIIHP
jgi:hypothetical protein